MVDEDRLRDAQGVFLTVGGVLAVTSLFRPSLPVSPFAVDATTRQFLPQTVGTLSAAIAFLVVGFTVAAAADSIEDELDRAALSAIAVVSLVGLAVGPRIVAIVCGVALVLAGLGMVLLLVDVENVRDRSA